MNEQIIGFDSFINLPSGTVRDFWMIHRLVILPDYQGLGLGIKFNEFCCDDMLSHGLKVYLKTARFKLMNYLKNSNLWDTQNIHFQKYNKSFDKFKNTLKDNENI
jgi:GNAT superfamily N-acetyltransferase